ncbi:MULTISPECIES: TrbI/VirB10 family protein [Xanthomonas]|uniref:TrbI/VirB10 family protein n=1 Tax=Xanthomonas sacchari TaxID=56458 RepID=A0AA46PQQ5_9XANT|nr:MULTISPECIES: TrbI/VirB10 family protein [Xanthomonas]MCW0366221.1 Type IV secretion system protein virB10 [Xanthomonas sacchari]MCW0395043.1 Type IV secretion system protein virB10 [Xanthomonas sacchari]MCW0435177.1 Type IV secretion system protein virB10 [Xanthomonas sacchari]MCW0440754.1 Type IV secretion system protein virB10 [Xanthomonas sacchari]MCW0444639.1 Type IV secretion system protein virB10 [Xanthomonas sacchari]
MNSNLPPSDENYGNDHGQPRSPHADDAPRENPYFARQQQTADPDLDANEPVLRSSDLKKLNRKALVFLGGIAALLILAIFWLVSGSSTPEPAPKPRQEAVVAPALPQTAAPPPVQPAEPVPLAEQPSLPPLPPMPTDTDTQMQSAPRQERGPSLLERRMAGLQQDAGGQGLGGMMPGQEQGGAPMQQEQETSAKPIANPDGLLVRGTYIRCVLETRIITDFPGFTSCIITEPVYSINGRRLLLPKGSKILGQYGPGEPTGPRMQVVWDRITTPTGIDVTLVGPGVDNLGSAGHPGQYSAHWASRISSALMISLLSDAFKWAAAEHGPKTTTTGLNSGIVTEQPYESNTAQSIQRLADQALDRRRPATVTINQGTIVNVYVAKDVDFTAVLPR